MKEFTKEISNYLGVGRKNTMPHEPYNNKMKNLRLHTEQLLPQEPMAFGSICVCNSTNWD